MSPTKSCPRPRLSTLISGSRFQFASTGGISSVTAGRISALSPLHTFRVVSETDVLCTSSSLGVVPCPLLSASLKRALG